jgi:hypothetical protein
MTTKLDKYHKEHNYIGNAEWQYKITNYFYRSCSGINYTAYVHDNLYLFLPREKYILNKLILKIIFDLQFIFMGTLRCLFKFQLHGIILSVILYLILLISSPVYIYFCSKNNGYKGV